MFGLFRKTPLTQTIGILEIGTGSVAASLVELNAAGAPRILFHCGQELAIGARRSVRDISQKLPILASRLLQTLIKEAALSRNEKGMITPRNISHVAVFLSSPWSASALRRLRFSRPTPFRVTKETVEKMLRDELRAQGKTAEGPVIERALVSLSLNGYPVSSLSETPVTSVEATILIAKADERIFRHLEEALRPFEKNTSYHGSLGAPYIALARIFGTGASYGYCMVGVETTEFLFVREGVPAAAASVPHGTALLTRTLAGAGIPPHEGASALKLARNETSRLKKTLDETLAHTMEEWRRPVRQVIAEVSSEGGIPRQWYLAVEAGDVHPFVEGLAREPLLTTLGLSPDVQEISLEHVGAAVIARKDIRIPTVLATLFADARFDAKKPIDLLSTRGSIALPREPALQA